MAPQIALTSFHSTYPEMFHPVFAAHTVYPPFYRPVDRDNAPSVCARRDASAHPLTPSICTVAGWLQHRKSPVCRRRRPNRSLSFWPVARLFTTAIRADTIFLATEV